MAWTCLSRRGEARRRYVCVIIWVECHSRWGWGEKAMILVLQFPFLFLNSVKSESGQHSMPLVGTTFYSPLTSSFYALKVQLVEDPQRHRCATSQHTFTQRHTKAQHTGRRSLKETWAVASILPCSSCTALKRWLLPSCA